LNRLLTATEKYVKEEKARIELEGDMLAKIAKGRGWGDINQPSINTVTEVAEFELKAFLAGT
jgi:hypothetical protein